MRRVALFAFVCLCGCPDSTNLCAHVKCDLGKVCDSANGTCIINLDAGTDGGTDAGMTHFDAGYVDAGTSCPGDCADAGNVCDRSQGVCVPCLTNLDCVCPKPPICSAQNVCVALDAGPTPDGGFPPPIPGESCAEAAPLSLAGCDVPRSITFGVDLSGRDDDEQGSCSAPSGGGGDVVFALGLNGTYDLDITVSPVVAGTVSPVVYLRSDFCVGGKELDCKQSVGGTVRLSFKSLPAATYWLVLDSYDSASGGPVNVTVTYSAPTQPANETCVLAADLRLSGLLMTDGGLTDGGVIVDLSRANDDEGTSCNPGGALTPDVVYSFTTLEATDLRVTSQGLTAGTLPVVELRTPACLLADSLVCRAASPGVPIDFRLRSVAPGTYYLVLEAAGTADAGSVWLNVTALAPSVEQVNETCATARPLDLPVAGGSLEVDVDTSVAHDDESSSCSTLMADGGPTPPFVGGSPEYVYKLTFTSQRNVTVTAVPDDPLVNPVLYWRNSPCEGGAEKCVDNFPANGTETLDAGRVDPGDYFLFVESTAQGTGLMHVTVTATP